MGKLIGKADPLVESMNRARTHKRSAKKHVSSIPPHVLAAWRVAYENFTRRHRNLKQGPLKLTYQLVNDWMEGHA